MFKMAGVVVTGLVWLAAAAAGQTDSSRAAAAAQAWTGAHRAELVEQFSQFLSIPNVAADPDGLRRNAAFLIQQLEQRGVSAQLLTLAGSPSVVYGEIQTPRAEHT
ncbi:MAG: hypothetical protein WB974_07495, partial [Acidobacteriaceae bacterium]